MYGNTPFAGESDTVKLDAKQRRALQRDLSSVAARTRELLPSEFVVGSEITSGMNGPEATVAVRPPVGSVVSAGYTLEDDREAEITEQEREDIARGLAASAALQVKQSLPNDDSPTAR
ncbi:DUF5811 family protein [Haloarculaceae archaeon H-GB2-1]|nr:DUF5811 family protein [Haloarculaceae archaeon H-GB1-1]MEA5385675.1 DUF5811 family protein [Haloarculaceae archaeon H-GB11]MEA5407176.1 DUF5811 family protein [Haloarculaceae archaeon H-GB2-1]